MSLHQWPLYPALAPPTRSNGEGRGYNLNVPLSPGARIGDYAAAFDRVISPVLEAYAPHSFWSRRGSMPTETTPWRACNSMRSPMAG